MFNYRKKKSLVTVCLSVFMLCGYASSEEIAPFRITGVDGELYLRYFNDEYRSKNSGVETSRREGKTFEEGLNVNVKSYIYHPNFFRLNFGGGPVFIRHIYDSGSIHISDGEEYFNFHGRANILEKKSYPLMLYYDRRYSTSPYAEQDRMLLRSEDYGLNFRLKRPLLPVQVVLNLSRSNIDGDNLQRVTDETSDRAYLGFSGNLGSNGTGSIGYTWTRSLSSSGSVSTMPIDEIERKVERVDAKTDHRFGIDDQMRFTNRLYYKEQDNLPDLHEFRYTPRVNLTHSDDLRSYYRYSYLERTVEKIDTTSHEFDTGMTHDSFADRLETSVDLHADKYETQGLQKTFYQGDLNLTYLQPYNAFNVQYAGGWGVDYTDQESDSSIVPVSSEEHAVTQINGTFELNNLNVIETSIRIVNTVGDVCLVGRHYEIITTDDRTEIRWLADLSDESCPLVDDSSVFVSYSYDSGGTVEYTGFRQLYRIDLTRGNNYRLFAKYRSIERNLESGNPTVPLNSEKTATVGLHVDYPFGNAWTLGGKVEHEDHDADIGSYRRDTVGTYLHIPRIIKGNIRLFADRLLVDYLDSPNDVDLERYGVRYRSRLWYRTKLTADYVYEKDTGGTQVRSNTRAKLRLNWDYRKLNLSAEARYDTYELGETERKQSSINLILARRF